MGLLCNLFNVFRLCLFAISQYRKPLSFLGKSVVSLLGHALIAACCVQAQCMSNASQRHVLGSYPCTRQSSVRRLQVPACALDAQILRNALSYFSSVVHCVAASDLQVRSSPSGTTFLCLCTGLLHSLFCTSSLNVACVVTWSAHVCVQNVKHVYLVRFLVFSALRVHLSMKPCLWSSCTLIPGSL